MSAAIDESLLPSSSSNTWYDTVEEEDQLEPAPSELNTASHPRYLVANKDKLTIRYVGKGNHTHDVGAIRANQPCPHRRLLYYFEITVLDAGSRGCIAVGLAGGSFELNRQPGWEANSYAYHGEDGRKYSESERGEAYGPSFTAGDVVGCGFLLSRREIFFTVNGRSLGPAFANVGRDLYPTVGLHSPGETVVLNFGAQPFKFDVSAVVEAERQTKLESVALYPVPQASMAALVRSYLLHYTHEKTLAALDSASPAGAAAGAAPAAASSAPAATDKGAAGEAMDVSEGAATDLPTNGASAASAKGSAAAGGDAAANGSNSAGSGGAGGSGGSGSGGALESHVREEGAREAALRATMAQRRRLRQLVLAGDVGGACDECERTAPGLLERHPDVRFLLRCQQFVEVSSAAAPNIHSEGSFSPSRRPADRPLTRSPAQPRPAAHASTHSPSPRLWTDGRHSSCEIASRWTRWRTRSSSSRRTASRPSAPSPRCCRTLWR